MRGKVKAPFRLGTTSYILPDEILPNVRYLTELVDDVELVLFEVDDGQNNLPSEDTVVELADLATRHSLSYTVHLPLDLRFGESGGTLDVSLQKARRVIERTRKLEPFAYVLHLEGRQARYYTNPADLKAWQDQAVESLRLVAGWAGAADRLAVENLEGYPPDFNAPVLEWIPASACLDIGHLWRDGHDPLPWLEAALPRLRVVHLHGVGERDHQSLKRMEPEKVDAVLHRLVQADYRGVVTLEVFGETDFASSLEVIQASLERLSPTPGGRPWAKS